MQPVSEYGTFLINKCYSFWSLCNESVYGNLVSACVTLAITVYILNLLIYRDRSSVTSQSPTLQPDGSSSHDTSGNDDCGSPTNPSIQGTSDSNSTDIYRGGHHGKRLSNDKSLPGKIVFRFLTGSEDPHEVSVDNIGRESIDIFRDILSRYRDIMEESQSERSSDVKDASTKNSRFVLTRNLNQHPNDKRETDIWMQGRHNKLRLMNPKITMFRLDDDNELLNLVYLGRLYKKDYSKLASNHICWIKRTYGVLNRKNSTDKVNMGRLMVFMNRVNRRIEFDKLKEDTEWEDYMNRSWSYRSLKGSGIPSGNSRDTDSHTMGTTEVSGKDHPKITAMEDNASDESTVHVSNSSGNDISHSIHAY